MGKSAPKPPDPYKTAETQTKASIEAGRATQDLNAITRTNPFARTDYGRGEDGKITSVNFGLNDELQTAAGGLSSAAAAAGGYLPGKKFDPATDVGSTDQISQTFFDKGAALMADPFKNQTSDFYTTMAERGLPVGSEAFDRSLGEMTRQQNLAYGDLGFNAALAAPQEHQRQFNNALTTRNQGYQDMGSILQLMNQMPNAGGGLPTVGVQAPDIAGLIQQNYAQESQNAADGNASIGSILGAGASLLAAPMTGGTSLAGVLGRGMFG